LLFVLTSVGACAFPSTSHTQPIDPCSVRTPSATAPQIELQKIGERLTRPVHVTHAGDRSGRLFVVEQIGRIFILKNGVLLPTPFLDMRNLVSCCGERGLLSVAFHPKYAQNGRFFVNYTKAAPGLKSVIAEYRVSSNNPDMADPTERVILEVDQPFSNHNGGLNKFGPDGFLYIGFGDGGAAGDPLEAGQDLGTLLGKILRIDIDGRPPYAVPPDNPFVDKAGARPEIWAFGLRNPWRFSFDRCDGRLFLGDVGQNRWEEVDLVEKGKNYGWNIMEGSHCFNPPEGCNRAGLELPIAEYDHSEGCSITGGYVYRGQRFPDLLGRYFFGDYCGGALWSLAPDPAGRWVMQRLARTGFSISSFGEDEEGELYLVDYSGGAIHRLLSK
jgi:glucose/arabinose dehydrogenase